MRNLIFIYTLVILPLCFSGCESRSKLQKEADLKVTVDSFETEFDDEEKFKKNWLIQGGEWHIENGALIGKGEGLDPDQIWLQIPLSDHYEVEFEISSPEAKDMNSLVAGNGKDWSGYPVIIAGWENTRSEIDVAYVREGGNESRDRISQKSTRVFEKDTVYKVKIICDPTRITVFIDDKEFLASKKSKTLYDTEHQFFGFYVWESSVKIENVKTKNIKE